MYIRFTPSPLACLSFFPFMLFYALYSFILSCSSCSYLLVFLILLPPRYYSLYSIISGSVKLRLKGLQFVHYMQKPCFLLGYPNMMNGHSLLSSLQIDTVSIIMMRAGWKTASSVILMNCVSTGRQCCINYEKLVSWGTCNSAPGAWLLLSHVCIYMQHVCIFGSLTSLIVALQMATSNLK